MQRIFWAALVGLIFSVQAQAQVPNNFPPLPANTVVGRLVTAGPAEAIPIDQLLAGIISAGGGDVGPFAYSDRSGTIAVGSSPQSLMTPNAARHGCHIQNLSNTDLWVNMKGAAANFGQPSMWLPSGSDYTCPATGASSGAFSIVGSVTGQAFTAEEW